ncbi:5-oxoprolinase subunit C family protein [Carboxydothermus ferrireducens]|uniref:Antagonist of KipI n=1 Tax=Carboxydothermus ferrireducens DSM 11255 TaxID=1119529 RepID=A0ABX2RD53_9THEO|nr:biotin-dependent carboxyltransferase family protein [Carboxydothermus ferrireducens]NYE57822.1 antagonist of KipI [Carboxydothermus ferrireducens DSM 11255]
MLKILKPGNLTTIQDGGRFGYQRYGLGPGGAMDLKAFSIANRLCGNEDLKAAIEFNAGITVKFCQSTVFALTGGKYRAFLDGGPVHFWQSYFAPAGSVLEITGPYGGNWGYLAVKGGFIVPEVLGGRGTNLLAGFGGFLGRALKKDDEIPFAEFEGNFKKRYFLPEGRFALYENDQIYFIQGPEWEYLSKDSVERLALQPFTLNPAFNRMGYRFSGPTLTLAEKEIISAPVPLGGMQVTKNGELIVLLADRQTTGGYPLIGVVAGESLSRLTQKTSKEKIFFKPIPLQEAEERLYNLNKVIEESFWEV